MATEGCRRLGRLRKDDLRFKEVSRSAKTDGLCLFSGSVYCQESGRAAGAQEEHRCRLEGKRITLWPRDRRLGHRPILCNHAVPVVSRGESLLPLFVSELPASRTAVSSRPPRPSPSILQRVRAGRSPTDQQPSERRSDASRSEAADHFGRPIHDETSTELRWPARVFLNV